MDRESPTANPPVKTEAKGIHINAREFLEAFRELSDDYYLMTKFSLKPKHLRKIYDQLMERGLIRSTSTTTERKNPLRLRKRLGYEQRHPLWFRHPIGPPRLAAHSRLSRPNLIRYHRAYHVYPLAPLR